MLSLAAVSTLFVLVIMLDVVSIHERCPVRVRGCAVMIIPTEKQVTVMNHF